MKLQKYIYVLIASFLYLPNQAQVIHFQVSNSDLLEALVSTLLWIIVIHN